MLLVTVSLLSLLVNVATIMYGQPRMVQNRGMDPSDQRLSDQAFGVLEVPLCLQLANCALLTVAFDESVLYTDTEQGNGSRIRK